MTKASENQLNEYLTVENKYIFLKRLISLLFR